MSEHANNAAAGSDTATTDGHRVHVCALDDLPDVGAVRADIDGRAVSIVRDSAGVVHAIDDTCTHQNVSLSEGEVEDSTIECWLHGSQFDLETGTPTALPATVPVAVHTVQLEGDDVYVTLDTGGTPPVSPSTADLLSHQNSSQQGAQSV